MGVTQSLDMNVTTAIAMVTVPPCGGGPALPDVSMTVTAGHSETPEAGFMGPAAEFAPVCCPAKAGNLTKAIDTVPAKASVPATALPLAAAKEAKEDPHTIAKEAPFPKDQHPK